MPLYTYSCTTCGSNYELFSSIDKRDGQRCPDCGSPISRKLDAPGMVWSPTRNNGHS